MNQAPSKNLPQLSFRRPASIVAIDSDLRRMRTWQRNMLRMKIPGVYGLIADGRNPPLQKHTFDQVIIDAPCSTLGVIRRHPEVKWWREESDLPGLSFLQLQILSACAKYVRSQGELIYSVCSFEPE